MADPREISRMVRRDRDRRMKAPKWATPFGTVQCTMGLGLGVSRDQEIEGVGCVVVRPQFLAHCAHCCSKWSRSL